MAQEEGKSRPNNKVTPKRIEFEDEEDRISLLPDCLLIEIISCLDLTKETIKTSTLSKRWQHLWTQVPNLILIHRNYTHSTTEFFSIVDKTLIQCCRQSTLTRFVLEVDYDVKFESLLNSWIRYAINRNVQEIDLSLCGVRVKAPFVLDQLIFTIRGTLVLRKLLLLNMTSLVEANLNFWKRVGMYSQEEEMLRNFVLNLPHVKELKIGRSCQEILQRLKAKGFTCPTNVKYIHYLGW